MDHRLFVKPKNIKILEEDLCDLGLDSDFSQPKRPELTQIRDIDRMSVRQRSY